MTGFCKLVAQFSLSLNSPIDNSNTGPLY